ncbi:MAG TPA: DUF4349 domain-containing protein [Anaerolineae bacterium]|nr:DUF4349 domain-containing protein [Anaerolineae bacterium]HNU03960.1 DUF4349 domain-containing protein [Anaerolineae bacterium]
MRRAAILALLVVALAVMAGCGNQAAPQYDAGVAMPQEAPVAAMPEMERDVTGAGGAQQGGAGAQSAAVDARKMIYTADIGIQVKDPATAMQQVEDLAVGAGGYTSQSQLYQYSGDLMRGMVVIRVPAESYGDTLARIRALGSRVLNESSNASDVTAEYTDLEAQLRNLEAAERELQVMLTEVREKPNAKPGDILEVYNALTQKRGEIEQVKGRLNYLANQVGFSTISVDLVPDQVTAPVVDEGWQPLVTIKNAFRALINIAQGLIDLLINLVIVVLPVLLLVILPIVLVIWLIRRWRRGRRSQAQATPPAAESDS